MSLPPWIAALAGKYKWLFVAEEPPPPPPTRTGDRRRRLPPPPPAEPPLSRRRLLMIAEAFVLAIACIYSARAWWLLAGGWPSRGHFQPPRLMQFPAVVDLHAGSGQLWVVGLKHLTLVPTDSRGAGMVNVARSLPSPVVTAVVPGEERTWIGTSRGLVFHDGRKVRRVEGSKLLRRAHITALAVDRAGRLWVGTAKQGLFLHADADGVWSQFNENLPTPFISALAPAGSREVWVGLFAGGLMRTDGENWQRYREPEAVKGKVVRDLTRLSDSTVLVMTDPPAGDSEPPSSGLFRVTGGMGNNAWREIAVSGLSAGDRILRNVPRRGSRWVTVLTQSGLVLRLDTHSGRTTRLEIPSPATVDPVAGPVTALAATGDALYFSQAHGVYRLQAGKVEPLTNWGSFLDLVRYRPPPADLPQGWDHPRFAPFAGRVALVALLVGVALWVRGRRWGATGDQHAWRAGMLRWVVAGCAAWCVFSLLQWRGWIDTRANEILWKPVLALAGAWVVWHWTGILRHEWRLRQDAFWTGVSLVLAATGAWLWWSQAALLPALFTCAVGALFFGRGLKGLREGTWQRTQLAWGVAVFIFQAGALLPPLVFAMMNWGSVAFTMNPTVALASGLSLPPKNFVWSPGGRLAAYVRETGPGGSPAVAILNGEREWIDWAQVQPTVFRVPTTEVSPQFSIEPPESPDSLRVVESKAVAFCHRTGDDTLVKLYAVDGRQRWQVRIAGTPVPGWQPCWLNDGTAMIVLTYVAKGTRVWKLDRTDGAPTNLLTAPQKLAWPSLAKDDSRLVCAVVKGSSKAPGVVSVSLRARRVADIVPAWHQPRSQWVFDPSATKEGEAIRDFLLDMKAKSRRGLERLRGAIQSVFGYFGWSKRVPELWISWSGSAEVDTGKPFRWDDYDAVREVILSADMQSVAFIGRRRDGLEEVLLMREGGADCRALHRTGGHLFDLRWAPYKNRLLVIEEQSSLLAPFLTRRLLMGSETVKFRPIVPLTRWVSAPQFSPDGRRVIYAALDHFWLPSLVPRVKFGLFEVELERGPGLDFSVEAAMKEKEAKAAAEKAEHG